MPDGRQTALGECAIDLRPAVPGPSAGGDSCYRAGMSEPEQLAAPLTLAGSAEPGTSGPVGTTDLLARRVEEASLNAWPATSQLLLDGWVVRLAQGFTKRANSVTALYPGVEDATFKVRFCENLYAREGLKAIFRITTIAAGDSLDALLAERGYTRQDPTDVLIRELDSTRPASPGPVPGAPDAPLQRVPLGAWLDAYARLSGLAPRTRALHGQLLRSIVPPCCHLILGSPAAPLACGMAVLERDLVGLFDVVTRADVRRAGYGHALVAGLLAWGRAEGARYAYLQKVADNLPADGLYRKLGFGPLYRYWYRVSG